MIRAASYNIRKSVGLDRKRDPRRILAVLNEIKADVIALQEVDSRVGKRLSTIDPALISEETDLKIVPVAIRPDSIGWHGNAILVRKDAEISAARRHELPVLEPRGAVSADIRLNGAEFRVIGMHLSLLKRFRERQITAIGEQLDDLANDLPTIVMGDTNEWRATGSLSALPPQFKVATPGPSFHSSQPIASLDRIILCDQLDLHTGEVHKSDLSRRASDHLPIWADLSVRAETIGA